MADKNDDKNKKGEEKADPIESQGKKNKLFIFIIIGVALLAALGAGGFIIFKTLSGKHAEPKPEAGAEGGAEASGEKKDGEKTEDKKSEDSKDHSADEKKSENKTDEKKPDDKSSNNEKDAHKDGEKKDGEKPADGKEGEAKKDVSSFGEVYSMSKLDLNLGNPIENRYLRLGVSIEYRGGKDQLEELQKRDVQLKDIIITTTTRKSRLDLLSETGKEKLRRELLNRINEVTDRPIDNIYFSEFLVE